MTTNRLKDAILVIFLLVLAASPSVAQPRDGGQSRTVRRSAVQNQQRTTTGSSTRQQSTSRQRVTTRQEALGLSTQQKNNTGKASAAQEPAPQGGNADLRANNNEVKIVADGEGVDRHEATVRALRSAVEQAYGAFISSRTNIFNDEVLTDEIVSISSGNIISYKVLSEANIGRSCFVSVEAVVSISKLASFAESHNEECNYDGNLLSYNISLMKLRASNTEKSLAHLVEKVNFLSKSAFDFRVEQIDTPIYAENNSSYYFPVTFSCYTNEVSEDIQSIVLNTLGALSLSREEIPDYENFVGTTKIFGYSLPGRYDSILMTPTLTQALYGRSLVAKDLGISTRMTFRHGMGAAKRWIMNVNFIETDNGNETVIYHDGYGTTYYKNRKPWRQVLSELKAGMWTTDIFVYYFRDSKSDVDVYDKAKRFMQEYDQFRGNPRGFGQDIDGLDNWATANGESTLVYKVKVFLKIPSDMLESFKGVSIGQSPEP